MGIRMAGPSRTPRKSRSILGTLIRGVLRLLGGFVVLLVATIVMLRFVDPPTWSWRIHRAIDPPPNYPQQPRHHWVALDQMPLALPLAVVAAEDQRFPWHHGIDLQAVREALKAADRGQPLRGASTLTQQTAKNLFLWSERAFSRKFLELGLALLLELLWDKQRILEVYLNIVEFGPGVYGVGAASEYWFHRPVQQISPAQAAQLAAILPNPWRYRAEPPSPYVRERSRWIGQQMLQLGDAWLNPVLD
ncbi:MAG: monofunctional biosynthetic peptidoglycan transglycosylase [Candidatus Thiodiazotropha sp.]